MPKVSVVVPIYGVEKYLHQCVDSILAQTLEDIEVILVDDGSKDKCPQIVDEYAAKDKRVVAVHQPNGGYGRAVNHGIELAKGEYIGIIESDDWIEPDMYEQMYNSAKANDTDITKCEFYKYNSLLPPEKQNEVYKGKNHDLDTAPDGVFSIKEYPLIIAFHASIWANIYKSDFIKQQKVIESKSASYQDFPFMIEAMCRAERITVVKRPLVHYRMEEGQNSSTVRRDERLLLMPKQCIEGKKILQSYGKYDALKEEFYFHACMTCRNFYENIYLKHKKAYFKIMEELFADLKNDKQFQYKYFDKYMLAFIRKVLRKNFIGTLVTFKDVRRFLIRINLHKGFFIQILGIQITNKDSTAPAILKLKV